ncbi:Rieske 2Fe-2S domain-containing protein [Desulfococcaceae bacterium HSG8]|nr:Rieske 2Fe-2S domain-containing protein [Desulfococcaceae bacterium HSG8]
MGLFARIFGICRTPLPAAPDAWSYTDKKVSVELESVPELSQPGSAIRLEGKGLPCKIFLLHGTDGNFYAFENKCTHMGRRLDLTADHEAIQCCSISESTYNYSGEIVSGPAKGNLKPLQLSVVRGQLSIACCTDD